ncbi:1-deoxy-D-xylulose-5-phosphate synthase [Planctomycetales bacterium]|nr:1-deoxy-D-xylulose-5-phosphate synthase [Planctomycetales bacterium]
MPQDLKKLTAEQYTQLASEIRNELKKVYDVRSVHFASNLGVVELCIALHSVFDFSKDKIVWDTGHQVYPHKILTGRFDRFQTIRSKGGLMGFPNPAESDYDVMMTGHAGCSVGTALGLRVGSDLVPEHHEQYSVAVIGDGAFTSGTVYEALNHAGGMRKNMTVILNDNKMSICPRVGGLANYLDSLRIHPNYTRFKQKLHNFIDNVPVFGSLLDRFFRRSKETLKTLLHGGLLFEAFGFRYIGPIDGHDISRLQRLLRKVRQLNEPVLLHVFTEKGRGDKEAEDNPTEYHAPKPGNENQDELSSEIIVSSEIIIIPAQKSQQNYSFTEHIRNAVASRMIENKRLCVITAAMCQGNKLEPVREVFPDRFFDVGICESHAVIFAAGLAKTGMKPVVDIYSTFLQRSYDQLFQEISLQNLPVIFTIDRAGLCGPDGPTHHGVFDLAYLRPFPNFVVMAPADAGDVEEMISLAIELNQPVAIRYPKTIAENTPRKVAPIELGKAEIVKEGSLGYVAVLGTFLATALQAVEQLDVGVINARFVKPLDTETLLQPLREGKFLITLEEGMLAGGFGSAVLEAANEEGLDCRRLKRLGIPDFYVEHGERQQLLDDLGLNVSGLQKQIQIVNGT